MITIKAMNLLIFPLIKGVAITYLLHICHKSLITTKTTSIKSTAR